MGGRRHARGHKRTRTADCDGAHGRGGIMATEADALGGASPSPRRPLASGDVAGVDPCDAISDPPVLLLRSRPGGDEATRDSTWWIGSSAHRDPTGRALEDLCRRAPLGG